MGVSVCEGYYRTIGAFPHGIGYRSVPCQAGTYVLVSIQSLLRSSGGKARFLSPTDLEHGLAWLEEQVGTPYGAWDALKQLGDLLFPHHPFACPPHAPHCSQLVLGYLTQMGISLTHLFPCSSHCSPNDLAEWVGLLPTRHRLPVLRERMGDTPDAS